MVADEIYFFNGSYVDPYDKIKTLFEDKVWKYNLSTHEWNYLGSVKKLNHNNSNPIKYRNSLVVIDENEIIKIDIVNNKTTTYNRSKHSNNIINYNSFFLDTKFYLFGYQDDSIVFKSVHESDLLKEKITEAPYYSNYNVLKYVGGALLFFILLVVSVRTFLKLLHRKNKIVLLENGLRYKNRFTEFDKTSMEIVLLLLSDEKVSSSKILKIVEEQQYSVAHNERIKVQKLEEIDFKIKTLLGLNEAIIHSKKSDLDRRIRVYYINKELFL